MAVAVVVARRPAAAGRPEPVTLLDGWCDTDPAAPISPRALWVQPVTFPVAKAFVRRHHYLHSTPAGHRLSLGVWVSGRLVGCLIFGHPLARHEDQDGTLELVRMVLLDECGRNSESRVLRVAARTLRQRMPQIHRLIAYADQDQGHEGTVYAAAGWKRVAVTARVTGLGWGNRPGRTTDAKGPKAKWEIRFA